MRQRRRRPKEVSSWQKQGEVETPDLVGESNDLRGLSPKFFCQIPRRPCFVLFGTHLDNPRNSMARSIVQVTSSTCPRKLSARYFETGVAVSRRPSDDGRPTCRVATGHGTRQEWPVSRERIPARTGGILPDFKRGFQAFSSSASSGALKVRRPRAVAFYRDLESCDRLGSNTM